MPPVSQYANHPDEIPEEPAISACSCSVCRKPHLFTDAEHIATRYLHADRHLTFREYLARRNKAPAPTAEIQRAIPVAGVRRIWSRAR